MGNYGGIQLPTITEGKLDSEKERRQILNYLALLDEMLRYMFQNIDIEENLSEDAKALFFQYGKDIQNVIKDSEGNFSMLRQTIGEISATVQDNKGNISLVQQTADRLATRISNAEGDISDVEQTADKINWIVRSGTSSSNFELTSRMAKLVAAEVDITGFVTFNDLERKGRTAINGGNITTGTIDADSVTLGSSYGGFECASGNDGKTTTTGAKMYGSNSDNYFIATGKGVRMTYGEEYAVYCTSNGVTLAGDYDFRAATNLYCMTSGGASLGTSRYHWDTVFADTGEINTSDKRQKNSIDYDMESYEKFFRLLKPTRYRMNNGRSGRFHTGFIAQDVEEALEAAGLESTDFAGFIKSPIYEGELANGEADESTPICDYGYALRYQEFIALNTHMIQRLMLRIDELEKRVAELEEDPL